MHIAKNGGYSLPARQQPDAARGRAVEYPLRRSPRIGSTSACGPVDPSTRFGMTRQPGLVLASIVTLRHPEYNRRFISSNGGFQCKQSICAAWCADLSRLDFLIVASFAACLRAGCGRRTSKTFIELGESPVAIHPTVDIADKVHAASRWWVAARRTSNNLYYHGGVSGVGVEDSA